MSTPYWQGENVTLYHGDCIEIMAGMPANSIDAVVCDPPYNLSFMAKPWDAFTGQEDAGFAYWLAGLIDGEGHFAIKEHTRGTHAPAFAMKMRADEQGTLEMICRKVGAGSITHEGKDPNPMVKWVVQDKQGCQRLVDLLDKYPLRAKKLADYWAWREAVCEWTERPRGNRWSGPADNSKMADLRKRLMDGRAYSSIPWSGHEFQDWCRLWATEALRVLKPGGHLLAFGGTRTWHRLAVAVEDAGFEIRDSIAWLYGSGFPKSLDVSKAIDKAAGAERAPGAPGPYSARRPRVEVSSVSAYADGVGDYGSSLVTAPATPAAQQWQGWGTALKPAFEPIVFARKPLAGTVAANVLAHGTGALNIDGCRIGTDEELQRLQSKTAMFAQEQRPWKERIDADNPKLLGSTKGRWPANVVLDADQAAALNQQSGTVASTGTPDRPAISTTYSNSEGYGGGIGRVQGPLYSDTGGASRFFYVAKAPTAERPTYYTRPCNCEGAYPCKAASQPRATDDSGSEPGRSWNTSTSGNKPTDGGYLPGMTSTTGTETSSTTTSATSNSSPSSSTNGSTQGASNAAANGGNPAGSAGSSNPLVPPTGTSAAKGGPYMGDADPAILPRWSQASSCGVCGLPAKREAHATVKPIDLMQWLIRLVTPPGGTVLDPFAGSGTTGEATIREGFASILIEREAEYLPLIRERFQRPINYLLDFGDPA